MRIKAAEPKAKRFAFGDCFQKRPKAFEAGTCRVAGAPAKLKVARAPPFALQTYSVAGIFQNIGVDPKLLGQESVQIAARLQTVRRLAGQHCCAGGRARRSGAKSMSKEYAFARHSIEVGCLDHVVTVDARVGPGPIVGQAKKNIRARIR